jgi:hypothetical protein
MRAKGNYMLMNGDTTNWLSRTRHVDIPAENLAAVLDNEALSFVFGEPIEVCYLALGQGPAAMAEHLLRQRRSLPWDRHWICDPKKADSVKIIVFDYRRSLNAAISTYSGFGEPCVEVAEDDLPFLLDDINQIIIGQEDPNLLCLIGWRLGRVHHAMRHLRHDEIMQLLKAPPSARDACWLLNHRDRLYGRPTWIKIEELPWSVPIAEWDVVVCKAVHPDGNAILFDGKWTWLPLSAFYYRYCQHVQRTDINVLSIWKTQLRIAAVRARALDHDDANEDDDIVGCASDEADFETGD